MQRVLHPYKLKHWYFLVILRKLNIILNDIFMWIQLNVYFLFACHHSFTLNPSASFYLYHSLLAQTPDTKKRDWVIRCSASLTLENQNNISFSPSHLSVFLSFSFASTPSCLSPSIYSQSPLLSVALHRLGRAFDHLRQQRCMRNKHSFS